MNGFYKAFYKIVRRNDAHLSYWHNTGAPIIGIDPAMTLVYRDEYPKALKAKMNYRVQLMQEFLSDLDLPKAGDGQVYQLFLHCTEKTAVPASAKLWQGIFEKSGLTLDVVTTGCCGMAGAYGHQAEHIKNSLGLYDLSWRDRISDQAVVTGYSCRSQIKRLSNVRALHPVEILNSAL
jgi:Fe-S oxidoreductase